MGNPEEWRDIPEYEGIYQVSSLGRVRRVASMPNAPAGLIRKARVDKDGYKFLPLSKNGVRKFLRVHRLVAMAFLGAPPDGERNLVLHGDGDPANNAVENLRWGSHSENQADSVAHGTHWEARRPECIRGHDITADNAYYDRHGKRSCRKCRLQASKKAREKAQRAGLPEGDPKHGSAYAYRTYGCRCDRCVRGFAASRPSRAGEKERLREKRKLREQNGESAI